MAMLHPHQAVAVRQDRCIRQGTEGFAVRIPNLLSQAHWHEQSHINRKVQKSLRKISRLFRDFFDHAEKKRRWNLRDDVPWGQCNRSLNPAIADVMETFCRR